MTVPDAVARYAPIVYLDGDDAYPPADVDGFLAGAYLAWSPTGREKDLKPVRDPVDVAKLLTESFTVNKKSYSAAALTRPFGDRAVRPIGLVHAAGFCLARRVKHPPFGKAARFKPVPVYYEYKPAGFITYWFFFEWSTLPLVGALDPDALDAEGRDALDEEDRIRNELPVELWEAFPDLAETYAEVGAEEELAEGIPLPDPVDSAKRFFRWVRERKPPRFPVIHEGDWERISVRLNDKEKMVQVAYYQHNGAPELIGAKEAGERPVVYVAKGSHASYPNPHKELSRRKLVKSLEVFGSDIEWQVEPEQLRDVRQEKWYGFGGAWGRPGIDSQQTGPLGPSRFKHPSPFSGPAG